jgi:uncharacterized protein YacL
MNISLAFIRVLFIFLSVLFMAAYSTINAREGFTLYNLIIGIVAGFSFGILLISVESLFKRFNLRVFNVAILGLFCGYLMGIAISLIFKAALNASALPMHSAPIEFIQILIFLFTTYLGMTLSVRAADEIYVSIPFIKFKSINHKKKDLLIDLSALMDTRIIDLAASGILDNNLVIPRFIIKELNAMLEANDDLLKTKARRCLEAVKKLENLPSLELRFADNDFPDLKDLQSKLARLARMLDANIITADMNRLQQTQMENSRVINLHLLANALKPITQTGETLQIKIQRYGKEPRQGVGYLEDGTMVVVNGGAEFIGDTIKSQVLSVKHTSSGRMIFCNAVEDGLLTSQEIEQKVSEMENTHKSYFAI